MKTALIDQFRYIKIQSKTIDLRTRLVGITTEFVGFISPTSLVLRSIVLDWILMYRNWSIRIGYPDLLHACDFICFNLTCHEENSALKRKAEVFKFLQFEERLRKTPLSSGMCAYCARSLCLEQDRRGVSSDYLGVVLFNVYMGRLRSEVQPLALLWTSLTDEIPLSYTFYWKKYPLSHTFITASYV